MKKVMSWLLLLSVGVFVIGCGGAEKPDKPIEKKNKSSEGK